MEPLIAQIMLFGGNFAPRGWAFCDGQHLSILSHPELFSILGTTYGGDGHATFGLPDLRGRVPMHAGAGPRLSPRRIGQKLGTESVTLSAVQMPTHNHELIAVNAAADKSRPGGGLIARANLFSETTTPTVALNPASVSTSGGGQAHDNMQPTLCINYIIALKGAFPLRS